MNSNIVFVILGSLSADIDEEEELPLTQGISFRRDIVGQQPANGHHHHLPPGSYHTMTFNHHRHPQQVSLYFDNEKLSDLNF